MKALAEKEKENSSVFHLLFCTSVRICSSVPLYQGL